MGAGASIPVPVAATAAVTGVKPSSISIAKPGFKKIEGAATSGGWKKVGGMTATKTTTTIMTATAMTTTTTTTMGGLNWINDGQVDYDPAYPTPA